MSQRYDGPILDAHHHLWDATLGRLPWLTDADTPLKSLGNLDDLRRSYLVEDYLADTEGMCFAGSVVVEAGWDRMRPAEEETIWLEGLQRPRQIARRIVGWAPLRSPQAAEVLASLATHQTMVGVRETIRWHPDPAKRWAEAGVLDTADWRRGAARLAAHGLLLEVLMNPYQAEDVARLARDMPDLTIVVNHCATPLDRDADGLARWKSGLRAMAAHPNVFIKLSNFAAYGDDRSLPALRDTVMACIDAFGPDRAMFGTDYPVARRLMSLADIVERFKDIVQAFSAPEQRAMMYGNCARLYRFDSEEGREP
jgi:predicted TIM-barrel fold metal-dependent hydrolase